MPDADETPSTDDARLAPDATPVPATRADATGADALADGAERPVARVLPWTLVIAASVILFDQGTKYWAEQTLTLREGVPVIGELIQWRLIYNPGAAFGIGGDFTWILTLVAAIAVIGLAIFVTRISSVPWAIAVGALFGGAISHLGDRLFRDPGFARGEIVDFIDYAGYFIGNVADIALVGGAIAIVILSLVGVNPKPLERREPAPSPAEPGDPTH